LKLINQKNIVFLCVGNLRLRPSRCILIYDIKKIPSSNPGLFDFSFHSHLQKRKAYSFP